MFFVSLLIYKSMKNIKQIIFGLSIIFAFNCHAQNSSGKIVYKIQLNGFGTDIKNTENKELNNAIVEIANKKTATLAFNSKQASFILDNQVLGESSNNALRIMAEKIAFIEVNGQNYFFDKIKNKTIMQNMDGLLVEKDSEKLDWEITAEQKQIDGYLCYKAIYLMKFLNRRGIPTSIPIEAWFAPSLPYGFGPKEYNGTPGLILELQEFDTIYYASSITILKDKELEIAFPKGKTVSQEDYTKKVLSN